MGEVVAAWEWASTRTMRYLRRRMCATGAASLVTTSATALQMATLHMSSQRHVGRRVTPSVPLKNSMSLRVLFAPLSRTLVAVLLSFVQMNKRSMLLQQRYLACKRRQ